MLVAHLDGFAGDGDVQSLRLQPGVEGGGLQHLLLPGQGLGEGLAHLVGQLTHDGALLGREPAHLLEQSGELTLFAQIPDSQGLQVGRRLGLTEGGEGLAPDLFQCFLHIRSSFA